MQLLKNIADATFSEVFSTIQGTVYQNDNEHCWYIDFAGKIARFDYRCLLKLKKAIDAINIEQKLMDARSADMEIIFICACDDTYILTLTQIIHFKELLQGTFVMLELNSIIYNKLYRVAV